YRAKGVAHETRKDQTIVDLAYGQIVFLRGEPERGLRIVAATAREFLEKCGDKRLHSIALATYGAMLMMQRSYRRALRAFDEAMLYAVEAEDKIHMTSILHNVSYCAVDLGLSGALPCRNISRERLEQFELNSELPKSRYLTY